MTRTLAAAAAATLASAALIAIPATSAQAGTIWDNCTAFNHKYHHGVGKAHAHDHTSGTPVRNFLHSNRKYRIAMNHNSDLDRDRDKIACEKA